MSDGEDTTPASKACFEAAWCMGQLGFEFKLSYFQAVFFGQATYPV